jgi:pimeloyl-ACP methyl ester carboxylesterase
MRRGYADTSVGQVHYREAGEGDAVLLLHHTASSSNAYARIQPLLAQEYRVIAMDTPGFGLSDPPPASPKGMGHYGAAAVGLLDALGIASTKIASVRTGASVAVELATEASDRVEALVFTGLVAIPTAEEREAKLREPSREAGPWPIDAQGEFLNEDGHVRRWVRNFAREDDPDQYLRELIAVLQAGPNFYWAYEAVVRYDAWDRLPTITQPALFLNPIGDPGFENAKTYQPRVPRSRYLELPGIEWRTPGWAWSPPAHPEAYARAVLDFFREPGC